MSEFDGVEGGSMRRRGTTIFFTAFADDMYRGSNFSFCCAFLRCHGLYQGIVVLLLIEKRLQLASVIVGHESGYVLHY
jgi:hypothetical protein